MSNTVDNTYINNAVDEIISLVGIKRQLDEGVVFHEFRLGNIKTCIEYIANHLNLPIVINLSYVSSDFTVKDNENRFASQDLVGTEKGGRGTDYIAAQVSIPSQLPLYGSPQFKGLPFNVKVSKSCLKYPETFIGIMAHELSHVVLHSLWHKEKNNEIYTDLTAMTLGFADIMKKGRKNFLVRQNNRVTETTTSTYGYLSDIQFDFAYEKIIDILSKYSAMEDSFRSGFLECLTRLQTCQEEISQLVDLLQIIDKKQDKRMGHEDALRVIQMHEPGYIEEIHSAINKSGKQLHDIDSALGSFPSYNSRTLDTLTECMNQINSVSTELLDTKNLIEGNIHILEKYQGLFRKIKKSLQKENPSK